MTGKGRDIAASVRQRLLNLTRERGEEFQSVLTRYGVERLLARLALSPRGGEFVLKGAVLFTVWTGAPHRTTRDLDLLGRGTPDVARMEEIFREIGVVPVTADGLVFDAGSVRGERIGEDLEYEGVRVHLMALLGKARIPLQVDVGFGDAVTPRPLKVNLPTLLDMPAPVLLAYPRETVVAEKFHAIVVRGIGNTRLKDFHDIRALALGFGFAGPTLGRAIGATFRRRRTPLPGVEPVGLSAEFAGDASRRTQWRAFIAKSRPVAASADLPEVVDAVRAFAMPPAAALLAGGTFESAWPAGGPWTTRTR